MPDIFDDPEVKAWAKRAVDELAPMIRASAVSVMITPTGETDVKFALELGFSIMLGKPIIVAVQPGQGIPEPLARVADAIVQIDYRDPKRSQAALNAALRRLLPDDLGHDL